MRRASQFVGRQAQLEHIEQNLYHIMTGQPRVVLMHGMAGMGKTRFLEQIRMMAAQQGFEVFAGHGHETFTQPYALFADLMKRLEARLPSDETGIGLLHEFTNRTALARQHNLPDPGESGKLRFMMTVTHAAIMLASRTPILLLVDDLHLADSSSLDLFAYLAFSLAGQQHAPLLLLGSYRPVPPASRLACLFRRLRHEDITQELELPGIGEAETRALLRNLGVIRPTQQLVGAVQKATHGIPLFIEEIVPHLVRNGALYARRGYLATRRGTVDTRQLPPNLADAIAIRVQTLPESCYPILGLAACLGEGFSAKQLQSIGPADALTVDEAIETGLSHGVLRRETDRLQFVHTLIRHAFRERLTPAQRSRLHLQIVRAFGRLYAGSLKTNMLEMAYHVVESGALADAETVVAYAGQAADQAFGIYAWHEAARYYEAALAAAHLTQRDVNHETARLYYRAALAHYRSQDMGPALARFEDAARAYRVLDNIYGLASALMWQTRLRFMHVAVPFGELPPDVSALQDVLVSLDDREPSLRGQLLEVLSQAYRHARQTERANDLARMALSLGRQAHDDRLCCRASDALGLAYLSGLHVQSAIHLLEASLKFGHRTDDLFLQNRALSTLPLAFNLAGNLDAAEATALEGVDATKIRQDWGEYSKACSHLASVAVAKGNFRTAGQYAEQSMRMAERSRDPQGGFLALQALAFSSTVRGFHEDAGQALDMMIEPGRLFASPGRFEQTLVRVFRQLALAYRGQPLTEHIASLCDDLMEVVAHDAYSLAPLCAMIELGRMTLNAAVTERPAAILADAVEQGVLFTSGWCFAIPRVLGVAAVMHEAWERAAGHFVHAMRVASEAEAWPELARAYLDFVSMERLIGGVAGQALVLELLENASLIFNELGMVLHARQAAEIQETILSPPVLSEEPDDELPDI